MFRLTLGPSAILGTRRLSTALGAGGFKVVGGAAVVGAGNGTKLPI